MFGILAFSLCAPVQRFVGRLLGVTASATLDGDVARVELRGAPVGYLSGDAWFSDDGVRLDAAFERALKRRLVAIEAVSRRGENVEVCVSLPIFGAKTISLKPE
jgi:hypothetical protein